MNSTTIDPKKSPAIIFLDIDGVLNYLPSHREYPSDAKIIEKATEIFNKSRDALELRERVIANSHLFSIESVKNLHHLLKKVQQLRPVQIVISSDWRLECTTKELKDFFANHLFSDLIIDKTPDKVYKQHCPTEPPSRGHRGHEILFWLQNHATSLTKYAIIDDCDLGISDLFDLNFVHVDGGQLLSSADCDLAYEILTQDLFPIYEKS